MERSRVPLIADANVLIDYADADRSILSLLVRHTGPVYVATAVVEKVEQLSVNECERLGLTVVVPTIEQLLEAGQGRPGIAFDDALCLILARDHGWCCMTNDKALRKACTSEGVGIAWGLEVMVDLIALAVLGVEDGCTTARRIRDNNAFITEEVVTEFERKVRALVTQRHGGKRDGQEPTDR
ncbi:MAG: hypothetical protein M0000_04070 [Actinomycetota bacterium]|nr:hypothetical protein [Actinomycetota bacterium]